MILSEKIWIKISNNQIKYWINKGYEIIGHNEVLEVLVSDLPKNSGQKIKVKCDICGKEKSISLNRYNINTKDGKTYYSCSRKCSENKNIETLNKKWKVDNISKCNEIKNKKKETSIKNNGVEYPMQSSEIIEKSKISKLQKYGNENYNNQEKRKQTSLLKYGLDIPTKSDEIKLKLSEKNRINYNDIINRFDSTYKYKSEDINYKNTHDYIEIECEIHGKFKQKAYKHISGQGCPKCNQSKGEKEIEKILIQNNIEFENQKRFKNCINKKTLPFDFYLPKYNICIEFDGIQHFETLDIFGGEIEFKKRKINDIIKNKFCKDNNIKLIRIKYDENIYFKLIDNLNKYILNYQHHIFYKSFYRALFGVLIYLDHNLL
jgi:hypothetical protein